MPVDRPCRGRQSQDRASGAETIDTDAGHASHGPIRKLALSEPPSNASGAIISPWRRWIASPHFQAIHHPRVDVARRLALLFGLGTKALPSWGFEDEVEQSFGRARRQYDGEVQADKRFSPHPSSREGHHSTAGWSSIVPLSLTSPPPVTTETHWPG
jgi:hypothetical protein